MSRRINAKASINLSLAAISLVLAACSFTGPPVGALGDGPDAQLGPDATSPGDGNQLDAGPVQADAGVAGDAAALPVMLSETTPDVAGGAADLCASNVTLDGTWYRIYPISDPYFSLPSGSAFLVSSVSFSVWKSEGNESVSVTLAKSTGGYPTIGNLSITSFVKYATATTGLGPISNGSQPTELHTVSFSPAVLVPAGTNLAVEIQSSGGVQLGATPSRAEWSTGWFYNGTCAGGGVIKASHGAILTVTGTPQ